MVTVGLTEMLVPVDPPGLQVYVLAPLPVKVVELPLQIDVAPLMLTVGDGFTVTPTVLVDEQPEVVPVTVYTVVDVGFTLTVGVVCPPGFHT